MVLDATTWYAVPTAKGVQLSLTGIWYGYVSLPLFQVRPEAPRFQNLIDGDPIHARRFHRHGLNAAGGQPVRQRIEVRRKGPKEPHRLGIAVCGHTRPDLLAANIQPGRVRVDTGTQVSAWGIRAAGTHGRASIARGHPHIQTRSGPIYPPCSTGSSPSPSDATTHHRTPDQNQSRQRAVHHTSGCTGFACLNVGYQYTPRRPCFCPHAYRTAVWHSRHNYRYSSGEFSRPYRISVTPQN
jgi:hypothetical protein